MDAHKLFFSMDKKIWITEYFYHFQQQEKFEKLYFDWAWFLHRSWRRWNGCTNEQKYSKREYLDLFSELLLYVFAHIWVWISWTDNFEKTDFGRWMKMNNTGQHNTFQRRRWSGDIDRGCKMWRRLLSGDYKLTIGRVFMAFQRSRLLLTQLVDLTNGSYRTHRCILDWLNIIVLFYIYTHSEWIGL